MTVHDATPVPTPAPAQVMRLAFALSLGAAVSLGITRFSYGLLLPSMREDLGWSYYGGTALASRSRPRCCR